jgi:Acetyltransferase (GNAT) family
MCLSPIHIGRKMPTLCLRRRALRAQEARDRWSPLKAEDPDVEEQAHLAFLVAVSTNGADEEVIGTLGLRRVGDQETARSDTAERSGLPSMGDWVASRDMGEIRRLRVALEWRRRGVATALTRQLITSSVALLRLRSLVLNTTSAQIPVSPKRFWPGISSMVTTYVRCVLAGVDYCTVSTHRTLSVRQAWPTDSSAASHGR